MKRATLIVILLWVVTGCNNKTYKTPTAVNKLDSLWLNSLINNSDSSYSKPYKRTDFVTTFFYINKRDSSVCQVMKDSADHIRQILMVKKNIRTHFSEYFPNGQLISAIPLNELGQNDGVAIFYYENGTVKVKGIIKNGLYAGEWKNFDKQGKLTSISKYNANGNLTQTIQP